MKNIFFVIISLSTLSTFSHSEAQIKNHNPNGEKTQPNNEIRFSIAEGEPHHPSPVNPNESPPAADDETAEPPIVSCEIPDDIEIIHFPMKSWERGSELTRTVQETIDTVKKGAGDTIAFFENLVNGDDDTPETNTNNKSPPIVEKIAISQFLLAQLIQKNPQAYVFHEFVGKIQDARELNDLMIEDLNPIQNPEQLPESRSREMKHLFQVVNQQFPNGIPEQYIKLDNNQKYILAIVGGVHTLFFLNELPVIFPSIPQEDFQRMWNDNFSTCQNKLSILNRCPSSNHFVQILRAEKLSIAVNNLLNLSPYTVGDELPSIILAYNGEYDLSPYFQNGKFYRIPDQCILPKTE